MLYSQNSSNEQSYQGVYWEEWTGISLKEFIQKEQAWEAVKYWIKTCIIDKSMLYEDLMRFKDKFQTDEYYYANAITELKEVLDKTKPIYR